MDDPYRSILLSIIDRQQATVMIERGGPVLECGGCPTYVQPAAGSPSDNFIMLAKWVN